MDATQRRIVLALSLVDRLQTTVKHRKVRLDALKAKQEIHPNNKSVLQRISHALRLQNRDYKALHAAMQRRMAKGILKVKTVPKVATELFKRAVTIPKQSVEIAHKLGKHPATAQALRKAVHLGQHLQIRMRDRYRTLKNKGASHDRLIQQHHDDIKDIEQHTRNAVDEIQEEGKKAGHKFTLKDAGNIALLVGALMFPAAAGVSEAVNETLQHNPSQRDIDSRRKQSQDEDEYSRNATRVHKHKGH